MDWMGDNVWALWVALAVVFGIVETLSLDLLFLMLAGGAASAALAAALGLPLAAQVLVAAAASAALLGVVRPVAKRHLERPIETRTGVAALIGRRGVVLERVDDRGGRIKLAGEIWTARTYDGSDPIEPGVAVAVVQIEGATALVYPTEDL